MNPDIDARSVPSQCKAKELKISDCKHAYHTTFLLVHFQLQCPFQIFRACLQQSSGGPFALCQQYDIICVAYAGNSPFLVLLVELVEVDVSQQW